MNIATFALSHATLVCRGTLVGNHHSAVCIFISSVVYFVKIVIKMEIKIVFFRGFY